MPARTYLANFPAALLFDIVFNYIQIKLGTTFSKLLPRLKQLDEAPEPLLQFMSRLKSTRLGLRFENLLWFWLQEDQYHPYQLLGHSIQKIDGAKTLGELDF